MKRDKIIISENRVSVTGNNIWMSATEIADLFNVTAASVNNAIRGILKTDILNDYEVCRTVRIDEIYILTYIGGYNRKMRFCDTSEPHNYLHFFGCLAKKV